MPEGWPVVFSVVRWGHGCVKLGAIRGANEFMHLCRLVVGGPDDSAVMHVIMAPDEVSYPIVCQAVDEGICRGWIRSRTRAEEVVGVVFGNQSLMAKDKGVFRPFWVRKPTGDPRLLLGNRGIVRIAGVVELIEEDEADVAVVEGVGEALRGDAVEGKVGAVEIGTHGKGKANLVVRRDVGVHANAEANVARRLIVHAILRLREDTRKFRSRSSPFSLVVPAEGIEADTGVVEVLSEEGAGIDAGLGTHVNRIANRDDEFDAFDNEFPIDSFDNVRCDCIRVLAVVARGISPLSIGNDAESPGPVRFLKRPCMPDEHRKHQR